MNKETEDNEDEISFHKLADIIKKRKPIDGNRLYDEFGDTPLSMTIAEVIAESISVNEEIGIWNRYQSCFGEPICVSFLKKEDIRHSYDIPYPNPLEKESGIKDIGGVFIAREGMPFFYRITEEKFRKGLKESNRLKVDRIRRPFTYLNEHLDRLNMYNHFDWKGTYFQFVNEVLENIPQVSEKKYGESFLLADAPVVFNDRDELVNVEMQREKYYGWNNRNDIARLLEKKLR
jgi:hypothetical protein